MKQRNQLLYQVKKSSIYRVLLVLVVISICWNNMLIAQCPYLVTSPTVPICKGAPITVTIEDLPNGAIVTSWQTSNSITFSNVLTQFNSGDESITFENGFQSNTFVRANILLGGIPLINFGCDNPFIGITVESPVSLNEISSSTYEIGCDTELPIQLTGVQNSTSVDAYNYIWQKSEDQVVWTNISGGGFPNLNILQLPNESIYVRRIISPFSCEPDTSNVIFLEIANTTDPGIIMGDASYCATSTPSDLTLTGHNGDVIQWEQSQNGSDFQVINNSSGLNQITPATTTGTTYYRALVQKGDCNPEYSPSVTVVIYPEMVNIIDAVNQELCAGDLPQPITGNDPATIVSGASILWQSKTIGESNWTNNPGGAILTSSTIEFTEALTETSFFRRVVSWGENCFSISDSVVVFISPQTDAGQFSDTDNEQIICIGEEAEIIELEDYTGEITDWYSSASPDGPWESLGVNSFEYAPGQIMEDTFFSVSVQSGVCDEANSDVYSILVNPPSAAGNFTDSDLTQQICPGSIPEPIVLNNYTGTILNWFLSTDSQGPWISLDHTSAVYNPGVIDEDTFFRVEVQSGSCEPVLTEVYSVLTHDPISNNSIYSDITLCEGETAPLLTGDFPTGGTQTHILLWQQKTASTGWVNASGDNNNLNYDPGLLDETTQFRRIVNPSENNCLSDTSNVVVVEIVAQPFGWLSGGGYYCPGGEGSIITVHLEGTPPFDFSFYDGQDTTTVYNINTNAHVMTVTADTITTYTLIGVSNEYCGVNSDLASSPVVVTPLPAIPEVSAGSDSTVCDLSYALSGTLPLGESQICSWTDAFGNVVSTEPEFTFNADERGIYEFTYTIFDTLCSESHSSDVTITLDVPEAAIAGQDQQICSDTTLLNAVPVEYWSGHWDLGDHEEELYLDFEFDEGTTLRNLAHGNTYEIAWITEPVLGMGVCDADTSWLSITVDPLSDSGFLTASDLQLCEGELASLELLDFTGGVTHWLFENSDGIEIVPDNATTFATDEFDTNTYVSVVVQSGTCAADTTDILALQVSPPTNAGVLNSDQQVCEGENTGTLEMSGFEGDILFWEYSDNDFETSNIIESGQTSYLFENLSTTTQFRTRIQSGYCDAVYSNIATVEVLPIEIVEFELQETYCSSDPEIDLSELVSNEFQGSWEINGVEETVFNPAEHTGNWVVITYANDQNMCAESVSQQTFVDEFPAIEIAADPEVCGLQTQIAVSSSAGTGTWIIDEAIALGGATTDESMDIVALEFGTYNLTWLAQNGACTNSSSQEISFFASPTAANAGESQVLDFTYEAELQANIPEVGIGTWSSSNPNLSFTDIYSPITTVKNLEVGENKLFWTIQNGNCPASISEVVVDVNGLVVPDAFSPNGDNVNDRYVIRGLEAIGPVELEVWNRWGKTVYQSSDYQNDWTGLSQNGNELQSDTYYYLIKAKSLDEIFKGFIVLQR